MSQHSEEDLFERLLVARSLALALNPTLERDEIAYRLLELAHGARTPLARVLARLVIRSLDSPSRAADRATDALRRALELQAGTQLDADAVVVDARRAPHSSWPMGPAA